MGFELFERKGSPSSASPVLTIQKKGMIALNEAAFKMIGGEEDVELLFDRERQVMALRPAAPAPHTYRLRKAASGSQRLLSASAFTKTYEVDTTRSRRYEPFLEDGMLCVKLSEDEREQ